MKPKKILKLLIAQTKVKLTDKRFSQLDADIPNDFIIHQIEEDSVNVYSDVSGDTYHDINFDEVLKLTDSEKTEQDFRLTYRSEIYIKAKSFAEARAKFEAMDIDDMHEKSDFVEEVSLEDENNVSENDYEDETD